MSSISHLPLLTTTDDEQGLLCAASEGAFEQVQYYLEKGASLNATDVEDGSTPLHLACRNGANGNYLRVVTLLLSKGAELNARNSQGRTPLHGACREGRMAIVSLLLDKGAQINAADNDGSTPLHLVCSNGQETVATWLLESGADVDAKDRNGRTSLDMANENGHGKIVTLLLKKKSERKRGTQLQQRRHSKMALNRTNESGLNSRPSSDATNDDQQLVKHGRSQHPTPELQPLAPTTDGDETISVLSDNMSRVSISSSKLPGVGPAQQQMDTRTMHKAGGNTEDDLGVATTCGLSNKRHVRSQSMNSLDEFSIWSDASSSTAAMLMKLIVEPEEDSRNKQVDGGKAELQRSVTYMPNDICSQKIEHPVMANLVSDRGPPQQQEVDLIHWPKREWIVNNDMSVATQPVETSKKVHARSHSFSSVGTLSVSTTSIYVGSVSMASMSNKFPMMDALPQTTTMEQLDCAKEQLQPLVTETRNDHNVHANNKEHLQPFVADVSPHDTDVYGKEHLHYVPSDTDVCFKQPKHLGTKRWREVIKRFSLDKEEFPSWQDKFCDMIQNQLRQEYNIGRFLLCRDEDGKPSQLKNGKWFMATQQEILAKTKQRFLDDRKPRKPKRPSKKQKSDNIIPNIGLATPSMATGFDLAAMLAQCRTAIEQHQIHTLTSQPSSPGASVTAHKMKKDLETIQQFVRTQTTVTSDNGNPVATNEAEKRLQVRSGPNNSKEADGASNVASAVTCASQSVQVVRSTKTLVVCSPTKVIPRDEIYKDDDDDDVGVAKVTAAQQGVPTAGHAGGECFTKSISADAAAEAGLLFEPFWGTTSLCFNEPQQVEHDFDECFVVLCRDMAESHPPI